MKSLITAIVGMLLILALGMGGGLVVSAQNISFIPLCASSALPALNDDDDDDDDDDDELELDEDFVAEFQGLFPPEIDSIQAYADSVGIPVEELDIPPGVLDDFEDADQAALTEQVLVALVAFAPCACTDPPGGECLTATCTLPPPPPLVCTRTGGRCVMGICTTETRISRCHAAPIGPLAAVGLALAAALGCFGAGRR